MKPVQHAPSTTLTAKGRATRERIVAAAAGEMFARGVAGTTLDDVKAAAGVSSSQLYHYFVDKQALVLAVIEFQTEAVVGAQEPMLSSLDSIDALRAYRDVVVASQRDVSCLGGCPVASLGAELAEVDDQARTLTADALRRWEVGIRSGLRAMHERGDLDADPERLALTFLASIQGGLLLTQMHRDIAPIETAMDTMIDLIAGLTRTEAR